MSVHRRSVAVLAVTLGALAFPGVAFATAPTVTSFSPTSGVRGAVVTVTGTGFTGATSVKFGGTVSAPTSVTDTSLHAAVPSGAVTGPISVTTPGGTGTSSQTFTVLPSVRGSIVAGPPTSTDVIYGDGFGKNEAVDIYEGATDVALAATDNGGRFGPVTITIPADAPPGTLWISAVGRHSQSAAQMSFSVRTDWTGLRGGPSGSGFNPFENVLAPGNVRGLRRMWTTTHGEGYANTPGGVAISGGRIVAKVEANNALVNLLPSGSQAWSATLTGAFFNDSSPAIGGSTVVAGGTDGHLHAYNLSTGSALWTTTGADVATSGPSPVVSGADVYSPAGSTLKDVALSNGAIKHTSSTSCTGGVTTPAVAGGTVVFACTDSAGFEYLNALGGDLSFRNAVNFASSAAMSSPAIAGARVYALIAGSLISRSISLFSGAGDWTATPPFTVASDVAAGDGVVAVCGSGGLWVVHAADGSTAFSSPGSACSAAPTIANDVIYVPEQEAISVYDLYGDLLTVLGTDGSTGNVAVVDGTVIAAVAISGVSQYAIPNGNNVGSSARARARTRRPNPRSLRPDRRLRLQHHHRARGARS